jgi:hypothetical protein
MSEDNSTLHNEGTPVTPEPLNRSIAKGEREVNMKREPFRQLGKRLFTRLAELGVANVTVGFDGFGDDGQIEYMEAKLHETGKGLALKQASFEGRSLYSAIEELIYAQLDTSHKGWQNEGGSSGKYVLDVPHRKVIEKFAWRDEGAQEEPQGDEE